MRISKKVREEAALICAIAASTGCSKSDAATFGVGTMRAAEAIAFAAVAAFWRAHRGERHEWAEQHAEAEAMLRTGWTP